MRHRSRTSTLDVLHHVEVMESRLAVEQARPPTGDDG
jgi:hypothetical protein